ncbi:MAG: hypothetical protein LUG95_05760 [Clostridiales bacterium]|nr:hypothetical protein [Clostridiales bacterium]
MIYKCIEWANASLSLLISLILNLFYAVWEIICGISYGFYWFATLGCYYILLILLCLILLSEARQFRQKENAQWKKYCVLGILLLLMNFILSGIVISAVTDGNGSHYGGYLIYVVAAYTFYRVIAAIKNLVKYRSSHNPVLAALKVINFISAMISLLSLEIAMILQFGNDEAFFKKKMTIFTGTVCVR